MSEHTPGPWVVGPFDDIWINVHVEAGKWVESSPDPRIIASASHLDGLPMAANARLIAAAPDLLAALKVAVDELLPFDEDGDQPGIRAAINAGRTAIAKAEGTAP